MFVGGEVGRQGEGVEELGSLLVVEELLVNELLHFMVLPLHVLLVLGVHGTHEPSALPDALAQWRPH